MMKIRRKKEEETYHHQRETQDSSQYPSQAAHSYPGIKQHVYYEAACLHLLRREDASMIYPQES